MQNDEDVNSKSVQARIMQEYEKVADRKVKNQVKTLVNLESITNRVT